MKNINRQSEKIRNYKTRTKINLNIGIFIFCFVCIYLVVSVFSSLTAKKIIAYEVREGSIVRDNSYTGLIVREEQILYAPRDGYVSYFQNENSKIKKGSRIYALSGKELDDTNITSLLSEEQTNQSSDTEEGGTYDTNTSQAEEENTGISEEIKNNLIQKTQNFIRTYNRQDFSSVYHLKDEFTTTMQNALNQTRTGKLEAAISQTSEDVSVYSGEIDGVLVLSVDGYEDLTEETLTEKVFDRANLNTTYFGDKIKITAGSPVGKLITDETWYAYILLDEKSVKELGGLTSVRTKIDKDSETVWADFDIVRQDGNIYGRLTYDTSMIRYADDRFLNIELVLSDESGLKIPKTALAEKEVYVVPYQCMMPTAYEDSGGVFLKTQRGRVFHAPWTQYYISYDENSQGNSGQFAYLPVSEYELKEPHSVMLPEDQIDGEWISSDTYIPFRNRKTLYGVYNINQGYAVFIPVEVVCENDDYYIVRSNTLTKLYNYDRIAQDSSAIKEEEFIFR